MFTYLPCVVSVAGLETLYWVETVTGPLDTEVGLEDAWVLVWLVGVSRCVVYVTELESS